jgi:hypothetical protein
LIGISYIVNESMVDPRLISGFVAKNHPFAEKLSFANHTMNTYPAVYMTQQQQQQVPGQYYPLMPDASYTGAAEDAEHLHHAVHGAGTSMLSAALIVLSNTLPKTTRNLSTSFATGLTSNF